MLSATIESARQTWLLLRYMRIWWIVLLASVVLAVVLYAVSGRAAERIGGQDLYCLAAWWLQTTVLAPWLTLHLGVQSVHGGIEDRTFQYLFLRPVGRGALLLGKWLAVTGAGTLLSLMLVGTMFGALALRSELWPVGLQWHLLVVFAQIQALGAAAYAAVAVLFSAAFRRPLVWAAFFVVGLQMLTANLDVSAGLRQLTITDPLRRLVIDGIQDDRLAERIWPAGREVLARARRDLDPATIGSPVRDLAVLTLVCLGLGLWRYSRTEYDSRERE